MTDHGSFHWNELITAAPERAAEFYAALSGCTVDTMAMPEGTYMVLMHGNTPRGGIMGNPPDDHGGTRWIPYLAVDDCDAAAKRTVELGGTVAREPYDIPGVGRIAMIVDPTGAELGLITPAAGPPS